MVTKTCGLQENNFLSDSNAYIDWSAFSRIWFNPSGEHQLLIDKGNSHINI